MGKLTKGDGRTEGEIRKELTDLKNGNRSFGSVSENKNQKVQEKNRQTFRIQLDEKVNILKRFFGNGFTYTQNNVEDNDVKVLKPSGEYFLIKDYEINGDILLNNSNPKAVYNKAGKLLYQGNEWSIKMFSYQDADLNKSYVCIYLRDDYTDSYKAIIGTSDDQVIIRMTDEVLSSASYKKSELFAVFGTTELGDLFSKSKIKLVDFFSTSSNDKFRYLALKVCNPNVTNLGSINYDYEIFDLKSGKPVKRVNESNVQSYLTKLLSK